MSQSTIKFDSNIKSGSIHNFLVKTIHSEWVELMRSDELTITATHWTRNQNGVLMHNPPRLEQVWEDYRWIKPLHEFVVSYKTYMSGHIPRMKMVSYKGKSVMFLNNIYYLPTVGTTYGAKISDSAIQPDNPEIAGVINAPCFYVPQGVGIGEIGFDDDFVETNPERTMKYALGNLLSPTDYNNFDYNEVEVMSVGEWVLDAMSEYESPSFENDPYIKMGNEILRELGISEKGFVKDEEDVDKAAVKQELTKLLNALRDIAGTLSQLTKK